MAGTNHANLILLLSPEMTKLILEYHKYLTLSVKRQYFFGCLSGGGKFHSTNKI